MSWVLKIKGLLFGLLLASPAIGLWMLHRTPPPAKRPEIQSVSFGGVVPLPENVTRVPVEVLSKGSAPEWVYVDVGNQAVPEPGIVSLVGFSALLLVFRRKRG
ncbi:MAG: PEP-CTERM sorting domain-containing protein [Verrucomicrobiota bacterium]